MGKKQQKIIVEEELDSSEAEEFDGNFSDESEGDSQDEAPIQLKKTEAKKLLENIPISKASKKVKKSKNKSNK